MSHDPKATYYDAGGIEVMEIIKAKLTPEQWRGFLLGNLLKYSCRMNFKHRNPMRDVEKSRVYLGKLFEAIDDDTEGPVAVDRVTQKGE